MTTGPGRSLRAISKAVRTVASSSSGSGTRKVLLGAGAHDVEHRRFLERIRSDRRSGNLSADQDDWNRVRHAIADRRHAVCCARTGCHNEHADLAARAGISGCHEAGALFVCRNDQFDRLHPWQDPDPRCDGTPHRRLEESRRRCNRKRYPRPGRQ